jgi:RimJ/RimL family protein N-acetyltransferase
MINSPLFETENYCLTEINFETDPLIDSQFTQDLRYARYWSGEGVVRPFSKNEMKKTYEKLEKKIEEKKNKFHFAVRSRSDSSLIGYARFDYVYWNDRCGEIKIAIGHPDYLGKAELELVEKLSYYGFRELDLYRIDCHASQFEVELISALQNTGYLKEAVFREAEYFNSTYLDRYIFGILQAEWIQKLEVQK